MAATAALVVVELDGVEGTAGLPCKAVLVSGGVAEGVQGAGAAEAARGTYVVAGGGAVDRVGAWQHGSLAGGGACSLVVEGLACMVHGAWGRVAGPCRGEAAPAWNHISLRRMTASLLR